MFYSDTCWNGICLSSEIQSVFSAGPAKLVGAGKGNIVWSIPSQKVLALSEMQKKKKKNSPKISSSKVNLF